ncbi:MAG: cell wall-binding repeat-containing protein, partial [Acidimicrobiales bacterium]
MRIIRRSAAIAAALLAAGWSLVPVAPAAAALPTTPVTITDPDDVATPLDIKTVTSVADAQFLTLTVETYEVTANPVTAFAWLLDVNDDGSYDYDIDASFDPVVSFVGTVSPRTGSTSAPVQVTRPTDRSLTVKVSLDNLNRPATLSYQTVSTFDTNGDGVIQNGELDVAGLDGQGDLVLRFAGNDRIETSVAVSEATYFDKEAGAVALAVSTGFADALSGGPLAAAKNAPLLLTGTAGLDQRVENEIRRVLPVGRTVYLLGGTAVLSDAVSVRLTSLGYTVTRFAGANRFETAVDIATRGLADPTTLLLSTGVDFP